MAQLFADQRHASRHEPPPPAEARRQALSALETMVRDHLPEIAQAISQDFGGRAVAETELLEAVPLLGAVRYARRHLARWMRPERRLVAWQFLPSRAYVRHEPLGVVGILSPWNYPLLLTLSPLVDALAAGNRALLKPSELTPCFSALLARLVSEAFPADRVAVVTGGPAVAAAFCALPFDHIVFTGSGAVARKVLAAAAPNLTPVTLELGGKSPAIVCRDFPLDKAAARLATGKWFNAGQTCIAPDYALIDTARQREFVQALQQQVRERYGDFSDADDYTRIINEGQYRRLQGYLAQARQRGVPVIPLAQVDEARADRERLLVPTVVLDPPDDLDLMREEIFGPILPVRAYPDLDAALADVLSRDRPLALYPFSHDTATVERILGQVVAGGVTVNDTLLHFAADGLPFGGVGASGMGAYHGRAGFDAMSKRLPVLWQSRWAASDRLRPPYSKIAGLLKLLLR